MEHTRLVMVTSPWCWRSALGLGMTKAADLSVWLWPGGPVEGALIPLEGLPFGSGGGSWSARLEHRRCMSNQPSKS